MDRERSLVGYSPWGRKELDIIVMVHRTNARAPQGSGKRCLSREHSARHTKSTRGMSAGKQVLQMLRI